MSGLSAEEIKAEFSMTAVWGETAVIPRWRVLQHVALNGMQHHTEIAQLLTLKGRSPGDLDFILYEG